MKSTSIRAQSLKVEWQRPEVTGRDDYYYILQYTDGESVRSNPVINRSQVVPQVISGLKPVTEYTITVTVVNAVSDQDRENEFKRRCELVVTTIEGGMDTKIVRMLDIIVLSYVSIVEYSGHEIHVGIFFPRHPV